MKHLGRMDFKAVVLIGEIWTLLASCREMSQEMASTLLQVWPVGQAEPESEQSWKHVRAPAAPRQLSPAAQ